MSPPVPRDNKVMFAILFIVLEDFFANVDAET
jgi:hypothetical protein